MSKKYTSVASAVKDLSRDTGFTSDLEQEISDRALSKAMFAMRCGAGLSQKQLAERMKCSQSRISKLEVSPNRAVKVSDLIDFGDAFDLDLSFMFHKPKKTVDWVKYHAFEIKKHLDHLAELAHKDPDIDKGVTEFFSEAAFNLLSFIQKSAEKLPNKEVRKSQPFTVSHPSEHCEAEDLLTEPVT